ncbi:hypothetical protein RX327_35070 [Bradyrhizobium sp. BEA-2-5]|uniref:hypothetical protein n=1 Tax=Bradyrhizobium sp. BEA-2-5 TaxID=3080015 RepID=UPI00293E3619|nr:hypothetical protein [Bradyrhizobium sp. BEA-2-5]WOH80907.1 hypothetical protein RX327_35070 [Bradyrhizobium sp. BEA-2-5]
MVQNFQFSDALFALDMKAPALRRWLQLGLIGNTAKGKAREGWTLEFTLFDLAVLALVKPMTEFGVPVAAAHKLAVREMREHAGPWSGDEPAHSYWTAWAPDTQILISRAEGRNGKPAWKIAMFEHAEEAFTSGAHLTLYPHALISAAIKRAIEAVEIKTKRSA